VFTLAKISSLTYPTTGLAVSPCRAVRIAVRGGLGGFGQVPSSMLRLHAERKRISPRIFYPFNTNKLRHPIPKDCMQSIPEEGYLVMDTPKLSRMISRFSTRCLDGLSIGIHRSTRGSSPPKWADACRPHTANRRDPSVISRASINACVKINESKQTVF
jgi:hypothetical protein